MGSYARSFIATLLVVLLTVGCDRSIGIKNSSTRNASVYVSIPESSGRALVNLAPGEESSADLGESGIYTVYVVADTVVTDAMTKVRDDLEKQLQQATDAAAIADLTTKLQAISKFSDQLTNRAASCGGKVEEGDADVVIGWDDTKNAFTAACTSKAASQP